jgi:hypothetical protein
MRNRNTEFEWKASSEGALWKVGKEILENTEMGLKATGYSSHVGVNELIHSFGK